MKRTSILVFLAFATVLLIPVLTLDTFDFDESLYRRVAESMRLEKNFWSLNWDTWPLHHKPPFFYWLIWAFSNLLGDAKEQVSAIASRLPSFLSTLGIGLSLFLGTKKLGLNGTNVLTIFATCLFPMLTGSAVVFDPLQTFLLMPFLLIATHFFLKNAPKDYPKHSFWLMGISLALATIAKGLNGLIIPAFAFTLQLTLSGSFRQIVNFIIHTVSPALLIISITFYVLDQKIGRPFTEEFLWVQHFGRSASAMENHGGGFWYHPLVIFLGGAYFSTLLGEALFFRKRAREWCRSSFPLVFALSFVLVFSFSATKLPHYTWPAWPAFAIWVSLRHQDQERPNSKWIRAAFTIPVFALAILATVPIWLKHPYAPEVSFLQKTALLGVVVSCVSFCWFWVKRKITLQQTFIFSVSSSILLLLAIIPILNQTLVRPFQEIAQIIKSKTPIGQALCIRYSGPQSPTLSLALAPEYLHNRCEPGAMNYLIAPAWKASECDERKMFVVAKSSYLTLCERKD